MGFATTALEVADDRRAVRFKQVAVAIRAINLCHWHLICPPED